MRWGGALIDWCHNRRFICFIVFMTIIKILLMGSFSSDYEELMFKPFLEHFFADVGRNPYESFLLRYGFIAFPYPPLMLLAEGVGYALMQFVRDNYFLSHVLFKLPLLLADFMGLYFMMKLYPHNRKPIGILYFASPIVLYAVYMHGQLDIIPTALLLGSIYFFFQKGLRAEVCFALLLVSALMTKLHILGVLPLILIYLWNKREYRKLGWGLGLMAAAFWLLSVTVSSYAFWHSVLFNREQSLITQVYLSFVDLKMYLPVLALAWLYLQAYMLRNINKDLFVGLCGLLFGIFLFCLPPMPGWYVWIVPFLTTFFIHVADNKYKNLYVYGLLDALYLVYFITAHHSNYVDLYFLGQDCSFLKVHSDVYTNVIFTMMAGTLAYLLLSLYRYGIASNVYYQKMGGSFAIGISGDSGAGKTTMLEILERCLGKKEMLYMEGDGYHRWERGAEEWDNITSLNPKANYLYKQSKDLSLLKKGMAVRRVEYDHATGTFTEARRYGPRKYILVCGLHSFYTPMMRRELDLKIFMDTDETLRRYWKIQRDTKKRDYPLEKVLSAIERRMPDAQKYIVPQKEYADLVVHYFDDTLTDPCVDFHQVRLNLRFTISADIDVEEMLSLIDATGIETDYDFTEDLTRQVVTFRGKHIDDAEIDFHSIMLRLVPHLEELTREDFTGLEVREGLIQMMVLLVISYKMREI